MVFLGCPTPPNTFTAVSPAFSAMSRTKFAMVRIVGDFFFFFRHILSGSLARQQANYKPSNPPWFRKSACQIVDPDTLQATASHDQNCFRIREVWQSVVPKVLSRQNASDIIGTVFVRRPSGGTRQSGKKKITIRSFGGGSPGGFRGRFGIFSSHSCCVACPAIRLAQTACLSDVRGPA